MVAPLKYDDIVGFFEKEQYTLLSREYRNCHTKMSVQCPRGHRYQVTWANFKQGYRCPHCVGRYNNTTKSIRARSRKYGYEVLSEYKNARSKLKFRCPKGHRFSMAWSNFWSSEQRCPFCYKKSQNRTDIGTISSYMLREGYNLISTTYVNRYVPLKVECPLGHIFNPTWANYKVGTRCPKCFYNRKRKSFVDIRQLIEEIGHKVMSDEYKNCYTKIHIQCPKGHQYQVTWTNFQQGRRCPKCGQQDLRKRFQADSKVVKDSINEEGYSFEPFIYQNSVDKFTLKCPEGHQFDTCWNYWQRGHRCPYCLHKSEHKLGQILEELFPNKIKKQGNLGFLGRQRVDYYIEEEKIAIEYDGEQHHKPIIGAFGAKTEEEAQEQLRETKQRDRKKEQLCKENGWRLIRIKYDEPLDLMYVKEKISEGGDSVCSNV